MKKTTVVNLLCGSGAGKSTTALLLAGELKLRGHSAELIQEYAKELAWERAQSGKKIMPHEQGILFGEQLSRESALYGKVETIITDSPLILCGVYQGYYGKPHGHIDTITPEIMSALSHIKNLGVNHLNVLIKRHKPFNPEGRFETEDQAREIDKAVESYLIKHNLPFVRVDEEDRARVNKLLLMLLGDEATL